MEPKTGEMVVANKVDHEQYPWINLTVKAVDSGVPPRYSVVDMFIQVTKNTISFSKVPICCNPLSATWFY